MENKNERLCSVRLFIFEVHIEFTLMYSVIVLTICTLYSLAFSMESLDIVKLARINKLVKGLCLYSVNITLLGHQTCNHSLIPFLT
jgi:hypothetical protein